MYIKESELFEPVQNFFEGLGYKVNGEVRGCDVTAVKDSILIIIELKTAFNLKLLFQAIERRKITDFVYVCIPRPEISNTKNWLNMIYVLKKCGFGLITVAVDSPLKTIDVILTPESHDIKNNKNTDYLLKEISGRTINLNTGGTNRKKIITAYKEKSVQIACALEKLGEASANLLVKQYNCPKDTRMVLYNNVYGWFFRPKKGIYRLTEKGRNALEQNDIEQLVSYYRNINDNESCESDGC